MVSAKTVIAAAVVLIACAGFLAADFDGVRAEDGTTGDCTWSISGTDLTVSAGSGTGNMKDYTSSDPAPWGTAGITKVVFLDGVKHVGTYAFSGCTSIEEVEFRGEADTVGEGAFEGCSSLKHITIKGNPTLGDRCLSLTDTGSQTLVALVPDGYTIPDSATGSCVSIRYDVDFYKSSVAFIDGEKDCGYTGSQITVSGSDIYGFDAECMEISGNVGTEPGAYTLTVSLKDGYAWSETDKITWDPVYLTWHIFNTVEGYEFMWILDGTELIISGEDADDDGIVEMKDYSDTDRAPWYGRTITELTVREVTHVGNYAFKDCTGLTEVSLPMRVSSVGSYAFAGCTNLTDVSVMGSIGEYAFLGCGSLRDIYIMSGGSSSVGSYAFRDCIGLNVVTFKGVPTLEDNSFNISDTVEHSFSTNVEPDEIPAASLGPKTTVKQIVYAKPSISVPGKYYYTGLDITVPDSGIQGFIAEYMTVSGNTEKDVGKYTLSVSPKDGVWSDGTTDAVTAEWEILENTAGDCMWVLNGTELTISGAGNMKDYTASDPAPWGTSVTKVTVASGVANIGARAFAGCTSLTSAVLPSELQSIGSEAFSGCVSLESLDIPSGVSYVDSKAFYGCTGLKTVDIAGRLTAVKDYAFSGCASLESITLPGTVNDLGTGVFSGCISLQTADIQCAIASVPERTFSGCISLQSVSLPSGAEAVDGYAFYGCTSLRSIDLSGMKTVNDYAFSDCTSLESVTVSDVLGTIGKYAFSGCAALASMTIPESVTSLGEGAFSGCSGMKELTVPISFDAASDSAFSGCTGIEKVVFTEGTGIGHGYSFDGTSADYYGNTPWYLSRSALKEVVFGDGIQEIGKYTFSGCTSLTTLVFPDSLGTVGDCAFYGCSSVASVTFGSIPSALGINSLELSDSPFTLVVYAPSVFEISVTASGSSGSIRFAVEKPTVLPSKVCAYTSGELSVDPEDLFGGYDDDIMEPVGTFSGTAEGRYIASLVPKDGYAWSDGTWGAVEASWHIAKNRTGNCYWYMDGTELVIAGSGAMADYKWGTNPSEWRSATKVTVEPGVTYIGSYAFNRCYSLATVSFGTAETIGKAAFASCALTEITVPGTVRTVGDSSFASISSLRTVILQEGIETVEGSAFYNCTSLESIVLPGTVKTLGSQAFMKCSSLRSAELECAVTALGTETFLNCISLRSVVLPSGLRTIGTGIFEGCASLESAVLPSGLTSIGMNAFKGCISLKSMDIPAGVTTIEREIFDGCASMKSIGIPAGVTAIGSEAFEGCASLVSVTLPSGLTAIDESAFSGCTSLESIDIPAGVTAIWGRSFEGCTSLKFAGIPASVTEIQDDAFKGCGSLTFVKFGGELQSLGSGSFELGSGTLAVYAPADVIDRVYGMFDSDVTGQDLKVLKAVPAKPTLTSDEFPYTGSAISAEGSISGFDVRYMRIESGSSATDVGIYTLAISLEDGYAWSDGTWGPVGLGWSIVQTTGDCTWVLNGTELIISGNGPMADYADTGPWGTGITEITIGDGVTSVGEYSFKGCTGVVSVRIPASVASIGGYAFSGCSGLKSVTLDGNPSFGKDCFALGDGCTLTVYPSASGGLIPSDASGNTAVRYAVLDASALRVSKEYDCTGSDITVPESDIDGFDGRYMTLSGATAADAGVHELSVALKTKDYIWSDGTDGAVTLQWSIVQDTGDCSWVINGTELTISGNGSTADYTDTGPWGTGITKVTVGSGVVYIGKNAFRGCSDLESVTFLGPISGFGDGSFEISSTDDLTFVVFPFGKTLIPESALGSHVAAVYATVVKPVLSVTGSYHVTGSPITVSESDIGGFDSVYMAVSGNTETAAGTHTFSAVPKTGYAWTDGTSDAVTASWTIEGHALGPVDKVPPDCISDGVDSYYICSICRMTFRDAAGNEPCTYADLILPHHTLTAVSEKSPSCSDEGVKTHTYCAECGRYFVEEEGTLVEKTKADVTVPALGHVFGAYSYQWAEDKSSCKAVRTCTREGCTGSETVDGTVTSATDAATCTEKGSTVYTAKFTGEGLTDQTETVEIPALGHHYAVTGYTWANDNLSCTARKDCDRDGCDAFAEETAAATRAEIAAPTCTEPGTDRYTTAAFADTDFKVQTKDVQIPAAGHSAEFVDEVPATSSADGVKAHHHCSVCGKNFSDAGGKTEVSDEDLRIPADGGDDGSSGNIAVYAAVGAVAILGLAGAAFVFMRRR